MTLRWRMEKTCHHSSGPAGCRNREERGALWRLSSAVAAIQIHTLISLNGITSNEGKKGAKDTEKERER